MSPEEIARRWPEAVAFARTIREVFGADVRLLCAINREGEQLGKPPVGYLAGPAHYGALNQEPDSPARPARKAARRDPAEALDL